MSNSYKINLKMSVAVISIFMLPLLSSISNLYSQMIAPSVRVNDIDQVETRIRSTNAMAAHNNNIYVVWQDDRENEDLSHIFMAVSNDNGDSFGADIHLFPDSQTNDLWPAIAVNQEGHIFIVYNRFVDTMPVLYFTKSTDGGNSFSEPIEIDSPNFGVQPVIAAYNQNVYVVYSDAYQENGSLIVNYFLSKSTDGGNTFEDAIQVNDLNDNTWLGIDSNINIYVDENEIIYTVWVDSRRDGIWDIFFAYSADQGATFTGHKQVHQTNASWHAYEKYRPVITADASEGHVFVGFLMEDEVFEDKVVVLAVSHDGGNSFLPGILPGPGGYPVDDISLAANNGTLKMALTTFHDPHGWGGWLYTSTDGAHTFSSPVPLNPVATAFQTRNTQIIMGNDNSVMALWADDRETDKFALESNIYFAKEILAEFPTIDPELFVFDNFDAFFLTLITTGLQTQITWNDMDASALETVMLYIEAIEDGDHIIEEVEFNYQIMDNDGTTATLIILSPAKQISPALPDKGPIAIQGDIQFTGGIKVPFAILLQETDFMADFFITDNTTGNNIHNASMYVHEMDETFFSEWGDIEMAFPHPGNYLLDFEAEGYESLHNFPIAIEENVLVHLFNIGLTPKFFVPDCDPFAIPLEENFSQVNPPDLPECWLGNTSQGGEVRTIDYSFFSPPNGLILLKGPDDEPYFISPPLGEDINTLEITFYASTIYLAYGIPTLEIGTISDPADLGSFTYYDHVNPSQPSFQQYSVNFAHYTGTDQRIAFRLSDNIVAQDLDVVLDNIMINFNIFELQLLSQPAEGGTTSGEGTWSSGAVVPVVQRHPKDSTFLTGEKKAW